MRCYLFPASRPPSGGAGGGTLPTPNGSRGWCWRCCCLCARPRDDRCTTGSRSEAHPPVEPPWRVGEMNFNCTISRSLRGGARRRAREAAALRCRASGALRAEPRRARFPAPEGPWWGSWHRGGEVSVMQPGGFLWRGGLSVSASVLLCKCLRARARVGKGCGFQTPPSKLKEIVDGL